MNITSASGVLVNNFNPEWIQQSLSGDEDAFAMLVETYQNPVFNLCFRMLGEETAAEDAAQETFWRAYQNLDRYDTKRSFITWLLSIAAHHCIDIQRKHKVGIFELDEYPDFDLADASVPTSEQAVVMNEEDRILHDLISQLNPPDRAAVILKYWYEYSEEEISQMLSLTLSAVKSRLHRARKSLALGISAQKNLLEQGGMPNEPRIV